jgi:hypothetical protein
MNIQARVTRLEGRIGQYSALADARALVSLLNEVDPFPEGTDLEQMSIDYAHKGLGLKAILKEIDGTSLGLPSERIMPCIKLQDKLPDILINTIKETLEKVPAYKDRIAKQTT